MSCLKNTCNFKSKILILFFSFMTPLLAKADGLEAMDRDVSNSIGKLNSFLKKFSELPCLAPESRKSLLRLAKESSEVEVAIHAAYLKYMVILAKPMQGSGKYNESFKLVAEESKKRAELTDKLISQIRDLHDHFSDSFDSNFENADIITQDASDSAKCADDGAKGQVLTGQYSEDVKNGIRDFTNKLAEEADHFRNYEAQNTKLEGNGGKIVGSGQQVLHSGEGSEHVGSVVGGERNRTDISGSENLKEEKNK